MSEITDTKTPVFDGKDFEKEVKRFAESIDSLLISLPSVMVTMQTEVKKQKVEFIKLLKASGTEQTATGEQNRFTLKGENVAKVLKMQRQLHNNETAYRLIHRSFLTSQISQYDAYLGRLLRLIYYVCPEKLNASEKQITFKELVQYGSIEEARERLIEREVDSVVRKSHEDQIAWITENLKLPIASFIPELPGFIEIAQRRHLFVHCDGVVSAPYIKNCTGAGVELPAEIDIGHQLEVTKEYLEDAFESVYVVGVKVGLALWIKLFKDVDAVARCVNAMAFELISNARYSLAKNLLEYALSGKQKPTDEQIYRFIILNLAQTYKWSGEKEKCAKLLGEHNWSASSDIIKLGVAALTEKHDGAFCIMRKLGHDEEFKKESYREWPVFSELRKHPGFLACYRDVYSEDFEQTTVVSTGPTAEVSLKQLPAPSSGSEADP
ncbi:MAG: hypothetical protein NTW21_42980 [Verrucomicrobia bacterium]|nr:hypothetical protein [Verrucomicrobiota bacterium]